MEIEPCSTCGGDGRIANSFGSLTTCPSCHGSGRRLPDEGFRDVTKTKASHHKKPAAAVAKVTGPTSPEGTMLAAQIRESTVCNDATKGRLIQEIVEHEATHGRCTQTFVKKIRKQILPRPA
ncbi:MAG: molecular chaperone DnaJ [Polyangiaceae bacterium]